MLPFTLPSCAGGGGGEGGGHVKKRRGRKAAIQGVLHTPLGAAPAPPHPGRSCMEQEQASLSWLQCLSQTRAPKNTETQPVVRGVSHCRSVPVQEARGNGYCTLDGVSGLIK